MAATSKYIIKADADHRNFIDFGLKYRNSTETVWLHDQAIEVIGSPKVDAFFARPGNAYDFTATGAGEDHIYLEGRWGDYTRGDLGTTHTLKRTVNGQDETVVVAAGDRLYYADLTVPVAYDNRPSDDPTIYPAVVQDPLLLPPVAPGSPLDAVVTAYAFDPAGETFATVRPGIDFKAIGGTGVDTVYVSRGSTVDASALGGGADQIYFTGRWEDYTRTVSGTKMVFSRTVGSDIEAVTVTTGLTAPNNDTLIFVDGAVSCRAAKAGLLVTHLADVTGSISARVAPLPNGPIIDPVAGDDIINAAEQGSVIITGTSSAYAHIALGTGNVHTTTADASGHWSYALQSADLSAMGQGAEAISAVAIDTAGNLSPTATRGITIDTLAPSTPSSAPVLDLASDSGVVGDGRTNDSTPTLTGTGTVGDTITVYDGANSIGTAVVRHNGDWSFTPATALDQGVHTLTTTESDGAGNTSGASPALSLTIITALKLTSTIDEVTNFDVTSDIVLTVDEAVTAEAGKYIHLVNDGGPGFHGEATANTLDILVTDTTKVTISDNHITINPGTDLDLSNTYHIAVDDGAFLGTTSGLRSAAVGTTDMNFSTVTPASTDLAHAAVSQMMTVGSDALVVGPSWLDIDGISSTTAQNPTNAGDLSTGKYRLVLADFNLTPSDPNVGDHVETKDFYVSVTGFGADDQVYVDNHGMAANTYLPNTTLLSNNGGPDGPVQLQFATLQPGSSSQSFLDMFVSGYDTSSVGTVDDLAVLLGSHAVIGG